MNAKSLFAVLVGIVLLTMAVAGCQPAQQPGEPPSQPQEQVNQGSVLTKSKYIAGVEATFPPWAWVEAGEFKGIAVDAIRAIAESEGINIEFQELP